MSEATFTRGPWRTGPTTRRMTLDKNERALFALAKSNLKKREAEISELRARIANVERFETSAIVANLDGVELTPSPSGYWVRYSDCHYAMQADAALSKATGAASLRPVEP